MDTFVKIVRILLVVSAVVGFLGKALYAGVSGLPLANALSEEFAFGLMTPLVIGTFCSLIWSIVGFFIDKNKNSRPIHGNSQL
ncbi:MAG: hypothetical protein LBU17_05985 [Treponema sp.]|nr:hypothetical protein [Treponema sp.]